MNLGLGLIAADEYFREGDRRELRERNKADYEEAKLDRATNRQRQAVADQRATEKWNLEKSEAERVAAERKGLQDAMTTAESYSPAAHSTAMGALKDVPADALEAAKSGLTKHFATPYSAGLDQAAGAYRKAGKLADASALSKEAERLKNEGVFEAVSAIRAGATPAEVRKIFDSTGNLRFDSDPTITPIKDKSGKVVDYKVSGSAGGQKFDRLVSEYENSAYTPKERAEMKRADILLDAELRKAKAAEAAAGRVGRTEDRVIAKEADVKKAEKAYHNALMFRSRINQNDPEGVALAQAAVEANAAKLASLGVKVPGAVRTNAPKVGKPGEVITYDDGSAYRIPEDVSELPSITERKSPSKNVFSMADVKARSARTGQPESEIIAQIKERGGVVR